MAHVPSLHSMIGDPGTARPGAVGPVLPWDYIRMRREAAGLSVEQAARPYWHRAEHQADVERNFRRIETVGFRMKSLWDMSRAFRLNLTVYRQLCDTPPARHPRLCLACGWDVWTPQLDLEDFDCAWSDDDPRICTLCAQTGRHVFPPRPATAHQIAA